MAQPNPSYPALCRQDTTSPWSTPSTEETSWKKKKLIQMTCLFSLPCNQSLLSSTQDSIESIATLQEANLDDEQIRALLALPPYLPEREASAERSQVYHSVREGLMHSSSQSTCGIIFTSEKIESRRICREGEQLVDVFGSDGSIFRNSNPANVA